MSDKKKEAIRVRWCMVWTVWVIAVWLLIPLWLPDDGSTWPRIQRAILSSLIGDMLTSVHLQGKRAVWEIMHWETWEE